MVKKLKILLQTKPNLSRRIKISNIPTSDGTPNSSQNNYSPLIFGLLRLNKILNPRTHLQIIKKNLIFIFSLIKTIHFFVANDQVLHSGALQFERRCGDRWRHHDFNAIIKRHVAQIIGRMHAIKQLVLDIGEQKCRFLGKTDEKRLQMLEFLRVNVRSGHIEPLGDDFLRIIAFIDRQMVADRRRRVDAVDDGARALGVDDQRGALERHAGTLRFHRIGRKLAH